MAYASQTSMELLFGTANVAEWSNKESDTETADSAAIAKAIEWADAEVDDELRKGPYTVPLPGTTPPRIEYIACVLAGALLYKAKGLRDGEDELMELEKDARRELRAYVLHHRELNAEREYGSPSGPVAVNM